MPGIRMKVIHTCRECSATHHIDLYVKDDRLAGGWDVEKIYEWVVSPDTQGTITKSIETTIAEELGNRLLNS